VVDLWLIDILARTMICENDWCSAIWSAFYAADPRSGCCFIALKAPIESPCAGSGQTYGLPSTCCRTSSGTEPRVLQLNYLIMMGKRVSATLSHFHMPHRQFGLASKFTILDARQYNTLRFGFVSRGVSRD
jgi:hypothetical protein